MQKNDNAGLLFWLLVIAGLVYLGNGNGCNLQVGGGATQFVLLHDAQQDDAAFSALNTALNDESGQLAKQIKEAGWSLLTLDDEAKDGGKQPLPLLKTLGVYGSITDARRVLLAVSPPDKLIASDPLPADATGDTVLALMQKRGKRK